MKTTLTPSALYHKHHRILWKVCRCLIVFAVPIIIGLLIFYQKEIYPFGENSLLSIDLWGQYFPMYRQYAESHTLSDMLYSWNGALGFNNYVQSAFYCHSPFLWFIKLVPIEYSVAYIDAVCLLRLGFSAACCQLFLEHRFKNSNPLLMACSVSYGLCAYAVAYIMQFMWTDLMILAPLVLLGVEYLLENRSPLLYITALTLTIYINFYVAFGVCIFTALYFMCEVLKHMQWTSWRLMNAKPLCAACGRFGLYSLLAGILNAATIIPTLTGLSLTASANTATVDFSKWYHSFADYISALLPLSEISLGYGTANIATGLFLFVLLPLYFLNIRISYREKLINAAFLLFLYCGLNYNPLDYIFNGFHFPNQLPGRWSFLLSLAMIGIAAQGILKTDGIRIKTIISAYIGGVGFLLFAKYGNITVLKSEHIHAWIIWMSVFCLFLCAYTLFTRHISEIHKQKNSRRNIARIGAMVCCVTLTCMIGAEVGQNALRVTTDVGSGLGTSNMLHYLKATGIFYRYGNVYDSNDNTFYRTENNEGWTFNDGQLGGYKGIGYYGSTMNGRVYRLLRHMGNRVYTLNISSLYNNSSPIQNSLFGIRYFIDRGKNLDKRLAGVHQIEAYKDAVIWENPTPLPLAFAADESIRNYFIGDSLQPIHAQNEIINRLYGENINVFEQHPPTARAYANCTLTSSSEWVAQSYHTENTAQPVAFTYRYVYEEEAPLYFEQNFRTGTMMLSVAGNETEVFVGTEPFKYVGTYPAGTEVTVTVTLTGTSDGHCGLNFYTLNTTRWQEVYNRLHEGGLTVTSFDNTVVTGQMTVNKPTTVFTSIPQDNGWRVYVDGKHVNDYVIMGALVGFDLTEGTHEITFRYHVPGLHTGVAVSFGAVILLIGCFVWRSIRKKQNIKCNTA